MEVENALELKLLLAQALGLAIVRNILTQSSKRHGHVMLVEENASDGCDIKRTLREGLRHLSNVWSSACRIDYSYSSSLDFTLLNEAVELSFECTGSTYASPNMSYLVLLRGVPLDFFDAATPRSNCKVDRRTLEALSVHADITLNDHPPFSHCDLFIDQGDLASA